MGGETRGGHRPPGYGSKNFLGLCPVHQGGQKKGPGGGGGNFPIFLFFLGGGGPLYFRVRRGGICNGRPKKLGQTARGRGGEIFSQRGLFGTRVGGRNGGRGPGGKVGLEAKEIGGNQGKRRSGQPQINFCLRFFKHKIREWAKSSPSGLGMFRLGPLGGAGMGGGNRKGFEFSQPLGAENVFDTGGKRDPRASLSFVGPKFPRGPQENTGGRGPAGRGFWGASPWGGTGGPRGLKIGVFQNHLFSGGFFFFRFGFGFSSGPNHFWEGGGSRLGSAPAEQKGAGGGGRGRAALPPRPFVIPREGGGGPKGGGGPGVFFHPRFVTEKKKQGTGQAFQKGIGGKTNHRILALFQKGW